MQNVMELVESGDRGACRAVADAGVCVGRVIASIVNVLNPKMVVIGGELATAGSVLFDPLRQAINNGSIATAAEAVQVTSGELGDRAVVLGAAALILSESPHDLLARVA
jgi:predicted NBD/HSP70 family sugar kinase